MLVNDKGNLHDVNILEVTSENYIVPKGEEIFYHCRIEQKQFNSQTGERTSVPRIQKFDRKMFETNLLHNLRQLGYSVDVLHNPTEWIKQHEKEMKEAKEKAEAKRKQMEEDAIQKRIDEAVAKALAAAKKTSKKGGNKE